MHSESRRWIEGTLAVATLAVVFAWAVSLLALARRQPFSGVMREAPDGGYGVNAEAALWVAGAVVAAGAVAALLQRSADRRSAKRYRCRLGFRLELYGTRFKASLQDISEKGAQVKIHGFIVSPGEAVILRIGDVRQRGEIVWTKGRRAGVRFTEEMPYDDFRAVLNRARRRGRLFGAAEEEN